MKILTNRKYKEMQDLIVGLQQDYNDLKDKQIDMQLELKYMQEQKELAERQVKYLQDELRRANDIKKPIKIVKVTPIQNMATSGAVKGDNLFVENEKPKRGRKPRKEKEDGTKK